MLAGYSPVELLLSRTDLDMEDSSDCTVHLFCAPKDIFKVPSKICSSDCKKTGTVY